MRSYFLLIFLTLIALALLVYNLALSGSVMAGYKEVIGTVYGVQPGCVYSVQAVSNNRVVGQSVSYNDKFSLILGDADVDFVVGGFKCDVFSKVIFQDQVFLGLNCNYLPTCAFRSSDVVGIGVSIGKPIGSKV